MEQPSANVPESAPAAAPVAGETGLAGNVYGSQKAAQRIQASVVTDEIAADYTQAFLEDTQMFRDFAEANRTAAEKLVDAAKAIIAKIKKTFGNRKQQNAAAVQETGYDLDTIENALKLWEKAYAEGQKAVKNAPVQEGTGEGVPKKSLDVAFAREKYKSVNLSEDSSVYTYAFLTSLPDMKALILPEIDVLRTDGKVDTAKVVGAGMKNARSVGTERDGKVFVNNRYTGATLRINANTIRHGLNGNASRLLTNSRLGAIIGEVVQNAVPINALHNKADGVTGTYAMVQYAMDSKGREFIAIVTVEQKSHNISGIEIYDVVHALSGRQKKSSQASTKLQSNNSIKAAKISISDVLNTVKNTHQSILSESVLKHFNEQRNPNGDYTEKAKFSVAGTENLLFEDGDTNDLPRKRAGQTPLIKSYSQRERVGRSIAKFAESLPGVESADVEYSRGLGSYETFYLNVDLGEDADGYGNSIQIRFSGHNSRGSTADYYLWNDNYANMAELKEDVKAIIETEKTGENLDFGNLPSTKRLRLPNQRYSISGTEDILFESQARVQGERDTKDWLKYLPAC